MRRRGFESYDQKNKNPGPPGTFSLSTEFTGTMKHLRKDGLRSTDTENNDLTIYSFNRRIILISVGVNLNFHQFRREMFNEAGVERCEQDMKNIE